MGENGACFAPDGTGEGVGDVGAVVLLDACVSVAVVVPIFDYSHEEMATLSMALTSKEASHASSRSRMDESCSMWGPFMAA